jgi:hypothetical protein
MGEMLIQQTNELHVVATNPEVRELVQHHVFWALSVCIGIGE